MVGALMTCSVRQVIWVRLIMIYISDFGVTLLCYCELTNSLQPFESHLALNLVID